MKEYRKTVTTLLIVVVLLIVVFMTGCASLTETLNPATPEVDKPTESDRFGVYIKLERDDAKSVGLYGGSFSTGCTNADGSLLKSGEWLFLGNEIAQLSRDENRSILSTVSARDADDALLGEGTFLYDVTQEKLYVTISTDYITCSTSEAPNAPADVPPVLTLPILDEIDASITMEAAGSSVPVVQMAVKLLDWGMNTGLDPYEISDAASTWLAAKNDDLTELLYKLELVDVVYQRLLSEDAQELLDSVGYNDVEITWGSNPIEPIEAIIQVAGLRSSDQEEWKITFEKSLFENYGAIPHHYEDLGDGVYQVYVEIDGKIVPYVAVDSKTGDYHG